MSRRSNRPRKAKPAGLLPASMAGLAPLIRINVNANSETNGITSAIFSAIVKSTLFLLVLAGIPLTLAPKKAGVPCERMTQFEDVTEDQKKAGWKHAAALRKRMILQGFAFLGGLLSAGIAGIRSLMADHSRTGENGVVAIE